MSEAMPGWLQVHIKAVLHEVLTILPGTERYRIPMDGTPDSEAVKYLLDIGALEIEEIPVLHIHSLRATAYGREFYERLTAPRRYWYRHNWFPAWVAGATVLAASVAAAANIVNLII